MCQYRWRKREADEHRREEKPRSLAVSERSRDSCFHFCRIKRFWSQPKIRNAAIERMCFVREKRLQVDVVLPLVVVVCFRFRAVVGLLVRPINSRYSDERPTRPTITPHGSVIKLQLFLKSRLGQNGYFTGRPPPPGKALRGQLRHGVF